MKYDHDAANAKRKSLVNVVKSVSSDSFFFDDQTASNIVEHFTEITPPQKEEVLMHLITMDSSRRPRARSSKPGNILFNWRKLLVYVPETTLAVIGTTTLPQWAIPLAALSLINSLNEAATEEFSTGEAVIILALWKNKNVSHGITEEYGLEQTNKLLEELLLPPIGQIDFSMAIDKLTSIKCIQLKNGLIFLVERVQIKY